MLTGACTRAQDEKRFLPFCLEVKQETVTLLLSIIEGCLDGARHCQGAPRPP